MTLQDLKDNRNEIISRINELGCGEKMKTFMEILAMNIEFFKGDDVIDFVNDTYNDSFRERAKRSGHSIAEICGNGIKSNGTEKNFNIKNYLH